MEGCSEISLETFLVQAEQPKVPQPFLTGEVPHSSNQLCGLLWICPTSSMSAVLGIPDATLLVGPHQRGRTPFHHLHVALLDLMRLPRAQSLPRSPWGVTCKLVPFCPPYRRGSVGHRSAPWPGGSKPCLGTQHPQKGAANWWELKHTPDLSWELHPTAKLGPWGRLNVQHSITCTKLFNSCKHSG